MSHGPSLPPQEALERLLEGNARYASGATTHAARLTAERRRELTGGQAPFASVLTCADSRTPPEHVFDAALGEIFVCRNAGNVLDDVVLGSFEYAAAHLGCPLLVVLGHDRCGAVGAAVSMVKDPAAHESPFVDEIARRLMPAVIATREGQRDDAAWTDAAARRNVTDVCRQVGQRSGLLRDRIARGHYRVVGAFYDLASGRVELLTD